MLRYFQREVSKDDSVSAHAAQTFDKLVKKIEMLKSRLHRDMIQMHVSTPEHDYETMEYNIQGELYCPVFLDQVDTIKHFSSIHYCE
jgi:hypothetical protein